MSTSANNQSWLNEESNAGNGAVTAEKLLSTITMRRGVISEAKEMVSRDLAPYFSFFHHVSPDEVALSSIFAEMLRPDGTHGQGAIYLRLFLDMLELGEVQAIHQINVYTEFQTIGSRRIDIFLESSEFIMAIENKPWATDQKDQLLDYSQFAKAKAGGMKKWWMVYLSNRQVGEDSIPAEQRHEMLRQGQMKEPDFHWVASWLEACAKETKAIQVRVFLEELTKFIRAEINGELLMSDEAQIRNVILKTADNIEAAVAIERTIFTVKSSLLKKLQSDIKNALPRISGRDLRPIWDEEILVWFKKYVGFGFKISEDQDIYLRFEFDGANLVNFFWGFARVNNKIASDEIRWQRIAERMKSRFGSGKNTEWWPWYSDLPDVEFSSKYKNWLESGHPWREIHTGIMAEKLVELAITTYKIFIDAHEEWLFFPGWEVRMMEKGSVGS